MESDYRHCSLSEGSPGDWTCHSPFQTKVLPRICLKGRKFKISLLSKAISLLMMIILGLFAHWALLQSIINKECCFRVYIVITPFCILNNVIIGSAICRPFATFDEKVSSQLIAPQCVDWLWMFGDQWKRSIIIWHLYLFLFVVFFFCFFPRHRYSNTDYTWIYAACLHGLFYCHPVLWWESSQNYMVTHTSINLLSVLCTYKLLP